MPDEAAFPPALDALIAAPQHHRLLMENERVRVLETHIGPGETTALHTHCWPSSLYVISFGHFVRRDDKGEVLVDTRRDGIELASGQAVWGTALAPHTLENVDEVPIHIIAVEVKPQ